MSCSFNWICTNSLRWGKAVTRPFKASRSTSIQFGCRGMRGGVARGQDGGVFHAAFPHGNDVADLHNGRRDVALAAVHFNMAVANHLAGLGAAGAEAHAIDHAVQTPFQQRHQVFTSDALCRGSLFKGARGTAVPERRTHGALSASRAIAGRSRQSSSPGPCHAGRE